MLTLVVYFGLILYAQRQLARRPYVLFRHNNVLLRTQVEPGQAPSLAGFCHAQSSPPVATWHSRPPAPGARTPPSALHGPAGMAASACTRRWARRMASCYPPPSVARPSPCPLLPFGVLQFQTRLLAAAFFLLSNTLFWYISGVRSHNCTRCAPPWHVQGATARGAAMPAPAACSAAGARTSYAPPLHLCM